jgi:FdhD protein
LPKRGIITSGCGGGVTFEEPEADIEPLTSELQISPERLFALFRQLHIPDSLHARARGVHASGLTDGEKIIALAEDVGRHNTLDKLRGSCLLPDYRLAQLADVVVYCHGACMGHHADRLCPSGNDEGLHPT